MDPKIILLIFKNKSKLERLIENNAPYEKILRQSQRLDKYIMIQINYMTEKGASISFPLIYL